MATNMYDTSGVLNRATTPTPLPYTPKTYTDEELANWDQAKGVPEGYKAINTIDKGGNQSLTYQPLQPGENPAWDTLQQLQYLANTANQTRYQDTLKTLGDTYSEALGLQQQKSTAPLTSAENLRYANATGGLQGNLLNRGLYNSTLMNSQQNGLDRTHALNLENINNESLDQAINLLTRGGQAKAGVMESKTDQGPNAAQIAQGFAQPGAMGQQFNPTNIQNPQDQAKVAAAAKAAADAAEAARAAKYSTPAVRQLAGTDANGNPIWAGAPNTRGTGQIATSPNSAQIQANNYGVNPEIAAEMAIENNLGGVSHTGTINGQQVDPNAAVSGYNPNAYYFPDGSGGTAGLGVLPANDQGYLQGTNVLPNPNNAPNSFITGQGNNFPDQSASGPSIFGDTSGDNWYQNLGYNSEDEAYADQFGGDYSE